MDNSECIFNPDYREGKERVSLTLDPLTVRNLKRVRGEGFNMSEFVNAVLKTVFDNDNRLKPHEYSNKLKEYKKVDLLLHIEVVRLLERLIAEQGSYKVARKLSFLISEGELFPHDMAKTHPLGIAHDLHNGDLNIYGQADLYDISMGRLKSINDHN